MTAVGGRSASASPRRESEHRFFSSQLTVLPLNYPVSSLFSLFPIVYMYRVNRLLMDCCQTVRGLVTDCCWTVAGLLMGC